MASAATDRITSRPIGEVHDSVRRAGLVCVLTEDRLGEVAGIMSRSNIGAVLVLEPSGRLAGIFTERDLLHHIGATGSLDAEATIGALMTPSPWGIEDNTTVGEVAGNMIKRGFRHAVIYDRNREPVGIVSMRDMLAALVGR